MAIVDNLAAQIRKFGYRSFATFPFPGLLFHKAKLLYVETENQDLDT